MATVKAGAVRLKISGADEDIFKLRYFARCLDCDFCEDACCNYGCSVDRADEVRLLSYRTELEPFLGIPVSNWFREGIIRDAEFPSRAFRRTRVRGGSASFMPVRNGGVFCTALP